MDKVGSRELYGGNNRKPRVRREEILAMNTEKKCESRVGQELGYARQLLCV